MPRILKPSNLGFCNTWTASFLTAAVLIVIMSGAETLAGAEYAVAVTGSDANNGQSLPFATISKAAAVAQAGDTVVIHAGTYHETLTPAHSGTSSAPITFAAAAGETVLIDGADPVSGWTTYQGAIMKASLGWTLGAGHNQVFCNGVLLTEAKLPKTTSDPLHPGTTAVSVSGSTITIPALTQAAGTWTGGLFWGAVGVANGAQGAPITASAPGSLTVDLSAGGMWFTGSGVGYVTGVLPALTAPGDWVIANGTIYLWPPTGITLSAADVEVKHRLQAVVLDNRQYITLSGVNVTTAAASLLNAVGCSIDGCAFSYLSHWIYDGVYATNGGIVISGSNNTVANSTVTWSAGCGINSYGANILISNCLIQDTDYAGTYAAAVNLGGSTILTHSTLAYSGRDIVYCEGLGGLQRQVTYNDLSHDGVIARDIGMIYAYGQDGQGTVIAYNDIHDTNSTVSCPGVYLDAGDSNFVVHHNVMFNLNNDGGMIVNGPATNISIYNNTLFNCKNIGDRGGYVPPTPYTVTALNNLFLGNPVTMTALSQVLANPAQGDYQLLAGDAAELNTGVVVAPYTNGYVGTAPDLGAYDFGGTAWTAGYTPVAASGSAGSTAAPSASATTTSTTGTAGSAAPGGTAATAASPTDLSSGAAGAAAGSSSGSGGSCGLGSGMALLGLGLVQALRGPRRARRSAAPERATPSGSAAPP